MTSINNYSSDLNPSDLRYLPEFIPLEKAHAIFVQLQKSLVLTTQPIRIYGKVFLQPRLVGFYAKSENLKYTYSRQVQYPQLFTPLLDELCQRVSKAAGEDFNACLCNLYRDGRDSMGWHADDEGELSPVIGSLSFGAARAIAFRKSGQTATSFKINLQPGSLLIMSGKIQEDWQHSIPKSKKISEPRLNLTFRRIVAEKY